MAEMNYSVKTNIWGTAVFLVFPAVFLFFALPFNRTQFGNDPEYAYLMNGINIGMLKPVGHTDNPGTTVQLYSALLLRTAHLFQKDTGDGFQKQVLRNSDQYIELERKGLIIINSLVMLMLGIVSWFFLGNMWLSLLLQIMPFTSANLTEHIFTKVSPEPVLFLAVAALVLLVIRYYVREQKASGKYAVWFAVVTAFGLATKATFLPLVLIPLLLLNSRVLRKRYLLYILPFFVLFSLPAVPQYPHMAKWFLGLTAHTGTYGEGGLGVIHPVNYVTDLYSIGINNPVLLVTLLAGIIVLLFQGLNSSFRYEFKNNTAFRVITAVTVAMLAGIFMVAKHYHANHYLIPELCMMAVLWVFIFLYLKEKLSWSYHRIFNIIPVLILWIVLTLLTMNRKVLQTANDGYIQSNADYLKMHQLLDTEYKDYTRTYFYPTSINPYSGLRWGNIYSKGKHLKALGELYPDGYFFDIRTKSFSLWETPVDARLLAAVTKNKLLIIGGPFQSADKVKIMQSGLELTLVYKGYSQIVYSAQVPDSTYIH